MKTICDYFCGSSNDPKHLDYALLALRIPLALTFIVHGWMKVSNMEGTIGFFASLGFGALLTYIVSYVELLGGIAILLGALSRLVGVLFIIIMVVAIFSVHLPNGFVNSSGGYEFNLLLIAASFVLALVGPGRISLHNKICK